MAGAGLFDLDKAMVGVVLPCDGRYLALSLDSVSRGLDLGRSADGRLRARYGLHVVSLDEPTQAHLRVKSGVLVSQVWSGFPADRSGLRPGDVIVGVEGTAVASLDELERLLTPSDSGATSLKVWSAGRAREVRLVERGAQTDSVSGLGLDLASPPPGFPIESVDPRSPAAEAGIREGDQLLRVDFATPRSTAEAARALARRGEPLFVEIGRGALRFGALLGRR